MDAILNSSQPVETSATLGSGSDSLTVDNVAQVLDDLLGSMARVPFLGAEQFQQKRTQFLSALREAMGRPDGNKADAWMIPPERRSKYPQMHPVHLHQVSGVWDVPLFKNLPAAPKVIAWCKRSEFDDALLRGQSFNAWRTPYSDMDMEIHVAVPNAGA